MQRSIEVGAQAPPREFGPMTTQMFVRYSGVFSSPGIESGASSLPAASDRSAAGMNCPNVPVDRVYVRLIAIT